MKKLLATTALLCASTIFMDSDAQGKEAFTSLIKTTLQKTPGKEIVSCTSNEEGHTSFNMIGGFVYYTDTSKNGQFQSEAEYSVWAQAVGAFDENTFDLSQIDSAEITYRTPTPTGDGLNEQGYMVRKVGNSYTLQKAHVEIVETAEEILAKVPLSLRQKHPSMTAQPVKRNVPDEVVGNYADITAVFKAIGERAKQSRPNQ